MGVPRKVEGLMLRSEHNLILDSAGREHRTEMKHRWRDGFVCGAIVFFVVGVVCGLLLTLALIDILIAS